MERTVTNRAARLSTPAGKGGNRLARRLAASLWPRSETPLPLWRIFPILFAALYLTHWSLLALPYFWDEAGYYIPAAWDFYRTGSLIPITTITNAHPPLPSLYLALWWRLGGFAPQVTREAMLVVAAFALLAVWRLAMRLNGSAIVAFWTVVLTGLYPIWFVQSTLAHADLLAAAATLWGLTYALDDPSGNHAPRPWLSAPCLAGIWFSVSVLAKETALATPLVLAAYELLAGLRAAGTQRKQSWTRAAWYCVCLAPLAAWYAYHYAKTGFLFGNPEFLRYNATATLTPLRFIAALGHRALHLLGHMNMFVPVLFTAAAMALDPLTDAQGQTRKRIAFPAQNRIYALLLGNAIAFSLLGGALLTRYLLPMYPLVLLVAVSTFHRRVRHWQLMALVSAAAFIAALFINPPYGFAPEDNLSYARMIRLHQRAIHELVKHESGATVLTAWPASDELTRPELGYVQSPFAVDRIEDFSSAQIDRAAEDPGGYSAAFLFSTKQEPGLLPFHLNSVLDSGAMEERYFGLHHDLSPAVVAQRLHGEIVWQQSDQLEWAAVLRFDRAVEARAAAPTAAPTGAPTLLGTPSQSAPPSLTAR